jgi:acetyl esterase/lipase
MKARRLSWFAAVVLSIAVPVSLSAQPAGKRKQRPADEGGMKNPNPPRRPDLANVPYGPHERNVLDLWKAASDRPTPLVIYIHGGGFSMGDKGTASKVFVDACLAHGISVAAINYRYSTQAVYPAPFMDSARAVQFLRLHAKEYNLAPKAFGATGGSAGAGISLWMGFHDDLADPNNGDPVLRQSTRLSAMAVTNAQTTYDPREIAKLIDPKTGRIGAIQVLFGVKQGEDPLKATELFKLYEDGSPITHLTAGAPPVFLYYTRPNAPLPPPDSGYGIHHPRFGYYLKEKMDKLGIECIMRTVDDYKGKPGVQYNLDMVDFFVTHVSKQ